MKNSKSNAWIAVGPPTLIATAVLRASADPTLSTNSSSTNSINTPAFSPVSSMGSSPGPFAAGIIVGEPTGGSLKYWLNDKMAVDGAFGWSFHDNSDFYLHSDVLWHNFDLIQVPQGRLPVYFGVGGLVRFRDDNHDNQVGIRAPVGLDYMPDNLPIDIFAEVGPAIDIAPNIRGEVTGGVGIRYRF